jgi:ribonuclease P protein component
LIWRIRERDAFVRLGRDGTRIRTSSLWCTFLPDPDATPPRVAFAIGRAVGSATTRNRLRRQIKALLRDVPPSVRSTTMPANPAMALPPGWYLFGARPSAIELTFDQLQVELTQLLRAVNR